jgi:hypothetical protein
MAAGMAAEKIFVSRLASLRTDIAGRFSRHQRALAARQSDFNSAAHVVECSGTTHAACRAAAEAQAAPAGPANAPSKAPTPTPTAVAKAGCI